MRDLILTLDNKSTIENKDLSEFDQLDKVEKLYVTDTVQQSIDERISAGSDTIKITKDYNQLKKTFNRLSIENKEKNEIIENLQRELSYRKQEVIAFKKIINEGELEAEVLKNENIQAKKEIEEYKFSLNNIEQKSHESILEIERNERQSKEAESIEDFYKKELDDLRKTLGKRKQEIKELRKMLNNTSQTKPKEKLYDNESSETISSLEKIIEEKTILINNLKSETDQLEILKNKYSNLKSKLKNIIIEGKRLGLEESLDLEDQLNQFKLLVKVSERVYAPKGYLSVLKYLSSNPGWVDLHFLSKQINMNPGVIYNILLELVDLNLAYIDEENNKAKARENSS
ncbi:MAG: hypothetical protein HeimC3_27600 [Candidatus Heimdallarchaeota archaeon LC_3]|nr:MAG: hypothetical protein HeimC3_27600 [Candidatus Heimdallarchaeota archaeon LC_3]